MNSNRKLVHKTSEVNTSSKATGTDVGVGITTSTGVDSKPTLAKRLDRIRQIAAEKNAIIDVEYKASTALVKSNKTTKYDIGKVIMQEVLPMWDDFNRGAPNPVIRSSLF